MRLIGAVLGVVLSLKFWYGFAAGALVGGPAVLKAWAWLKDRVAKAVL